MTGIGIAIKRTLSQP